MANEGGNNGALRELLDEAGVNNAALARAVVAVGCRAGVHVRTSTTSVRRMLAGCQRRWPVPRLVATVLSRRLHYEVSVTDCGFADRAAVSEDLHDGLHCSGTLDGTLRTVVELSGRDMRRRKFLLISASSAAAFAEPALFALTVPPAESTAWAGGRRGDPHRTGHAPEAAGLPLWLRAGPRADGAVAAPRGQYCPNGVRNSTASPTHAQPR